MGWLSVSFSIFHFPSMIFFNHTQHILVSRDDCASWVHTASPRNEENQRFQLDVLFHSLRSCLLWTDASTNKDSLIPPRKQVLNIHTDPQCQAYKGYILIIKSFCSDLAVNWTCVTSSGRSGARWRSRSKGTFAEDSLSHFSFSCLFLLRSKHLS